MIAENHDVITLGWTPPKGVEWYTFFENHKRVSNSPPADKNGAVKKQAVFARLFPIQVVAIVQTSPGAFDVAVGTYSPPVVEPPAVVFPNAPGVFAQKAGAANPDPSYGAAIRAATTILQLSGGNWGIPVYFATDTDPLVTATAYGYPGSGIVGTGRFRCPANAQPTSNPDGSYSDGHCVIVQPDGSWWEMFRAARTANGDWTCKALGHASPGQDWWPRDNCREADSTLPAGIISLDELDAKKIDHALAGIFPNAWGRDQVNRRFVLDGALPSSLTAVERTVGVALQTYGLYVVDHTSGSDMSFQCQAGVVGYPSLSGLLPVLTNLRAVA